MRVLLWRAVIWVWSYSEHLHWKHALMASILAHGYAEDAARWRAFGSVLEESRALARAARAQLRSDKAREKALKARKTIRGAEREIHLLYAASSSRSRS